MANKGMLGSSTSEHRSQNHGQTANNAARGPNEAPTPSGPSVSPRIPEASSHLVLFQHAYNLNTAPPPPQKWLICHRALQDDMEGRTLTNVLLFSLRPSAVPPTLAVFCL
jgi:hypothetical protein